MKKIKIPELLAPAGSMESAVAAINAGADALYLGGKNFSARNFAQNFTQDQLVSLIEYGALRDVKVYIAVNTLYKNDEISQVFEFAKTMYKHGAAAFILQDVGLAYMLKQKMPGMEIHASTQMTVHSTAGICFMADMGFSRVILSRELSLGEVAEINNAAKKANVKCEVFVHGALCISYSGQCLMSSLIGGRSGNRGRCAQICRTKYDLIKGGLAENDLIKNGLLKSDLIKSGYLLSPKDMMTIEILEDIVAAGVSSLKIEGRMKSPEYVYLVTKAYRQQLDNIKAGRATNVDKNQLRDLLQIFNRGGSSSTGYYNTYSGPDMMSIITPKSTGVLAGTVVSNKNGRCKIKFSESMIPGDGIEIWASHGEHVGKGIERIINPGDTFEFSIEGGIEKGNYVYKSYDKRLISDIKKEMVTAEKKVRVYGEVEAVIGSKLKLSLFRDGTGDGVSVGIGNDVKTGIREDIKVTATGDVVEAARRAPMSKDEIVRQLLKTGNTPFKIAFSKVNIDENIFVSKSVLNQLRRTALEMLETEIIKNSKKETLEVTNEDEFFELLCNESNSNYKTQQKLSVQISRIDNLSAVLSLSKSASNQGILNSGVSNSSVSNKIITNSNTSNINISSLGALSRDISRIYINYTPENMVALPGALKTLKASNNKIKTEIFIALPYISRNSVEEDIKNTLIQLESADIDGYLVSTYGQLHILKSIGSKKQIILNYTFNIFNNWAIKAFESMGIMEVTLSQELNIREIEAMKPCKFELVVYGRQTLMATHTCPVGIYGTSGKNSKNKNCISNKSEIISNKVESTNNKKGKYCSKRHTGESYGLRDKMGMVFPILRDCHNCIAYVLNSKTLDTSPKFQALKATGAESFRLIFTDEDEQTIKEVIMRYKNALLGIKDNYQSQDATYGHFFRGVD